MSLNNFQSSNIRRTPYVSTLNNSVLPSSNSSQSNSNSIMDVFSTPVQPTHLSKMSSLQSPINNTPHHPHHSNIDNSHPPNLKLEPGFVSSKSKSNSESKSNSNSNSRLTGITPSTSNFSNSHISLNSYTPNNNINNGNNNSRISLHNTNTNNHNNINQNITINTSTSAIKHYHSNNISNNNNNNNTINGTVTNNNNNHNNNVNYRSHSRYPSDVTDHQQHENFDHPNFILNTPERALLTLPNPIQLPHSYIHQQKSLNQYSPYESVPSSLNSHVHSLSLDTVTSTYSTKSISNDDWYSTNTISNNNNYNNNNNNNNSIYHHRHTYSNSSSIITPPIEDSTLMALAKEYAESPIDDLASEVKEIERQISDSSSNLRNPKENRNLQIQRKKKQQLFALVSLIKTVKISENSVCPRNVVYSKYVEICKKFKINQICNAAFGKLVKVFYPGIKTRRLGVRGSSRYNYCGIELIENNENNSIKIENNDNDDNNNDIYNWDTDSTIKKLNKDEIDNNIKKSVKLNSEFNIKNLNNLAFENDLFTKLDSTVEFIPDFYKNISLSMLKDSHRVILDNYCEFLLQIFKDWRYLKIESLFNEIDNFNFETRLSDEYFAVYEMEYNELSPFIQQCNLEAYKSAIKLISKIVFQQVPDNVQTALCNFEKSYLDHVKNMNIKKSISDDNLKIATKFISIISILRKVVFLSSSASKLLSNNETKLLFCKEWDDINILKIINDHPLLPRNYEFENCSIKVKKICQYLSQIFKSLNSDNIANNNNGNNDNMNDFKDDIIRKLSISFASIPVEFSHIEPSKLLLYIEAIGSTILRELTVENFTSIFSVWWSLVCWCNEYMLLMAEIGGFLK